MSDLIQKAVELADGFEACIDPNDELWIGINGGKPTSVYQSTWYVEDAPQWVLDALAAQLVRQVDALDTHGFLSDESLASGVYHCGSGSNCTIADSPDRTLNTIKAIVDSGVLDD